MLKANQLEVELKLRELTYVDEPSPLFVHRLWMKIKKQNPQVKRISAPRVLHWRPVWIVLLVLVIVLSALFIGFGPQKVYGFIRQIFGFSDAGLQAVQEAGLVTDLDISAQPTVVTAGGSDINMPKEAHQVSLSQTVEDMTVTLDWVYIDEGRLALAFTPDTVPPELAFSSPTLTFSGFTPKQKEGSIQSIRNEEQQYIFISYQVIQVDVVGETIDFSVDLPLMEPAEPEWQQRAVFHFDLTGIPVYRGRTIPLQQTSSVSINGVEVRLNAINMTPAYTELTVCYDFPAGDAPFWHIFDSTLQIGDSPEEKQVSYDYLQENEEDHCVKIGFGIGSAVPGDRLVFRVNKMEVPLTIQDELPAERIYAANETLAEHGIEIAPAPAEESAGPGGWVFVTEPDWGMTPEEDPRLIVYHTLLETMPGPWTFYVDIPKSADFNPEELEPTETVSAPIDSQTQSDITVTLDWVFVDALRVGVGYTVTGLPDVPEATGLLGEIFIDSPQDIGIGGTGIGSSTISRVEGQPDAVQGTWSVGFQEPLTEPEATFTLAITLGSNDSELHYYIAGFPVAPEATPYPMGEFPPDLTEGLVGTYTFEFTAPVHPMTVIDQTTPVTVNDTLFLVPRAEVTASTSKVMVCYQKPTERDWWIMDASLQNGDKEASSSGGRLLYDADFQLKDSTFIDLSKWEVPDSFLDVEHGRCVILNFLQGQSNPAEPLILTVESLEISPPEVYPEEELAAAREILLAEGIEFTNEVFRGSGGGGGGINFTTLPEGMTWETAHQKFMEALGYTHNGPWEITVIDKP